MFLGNPRVVSISSLHGVAHIPLFFHQQYRCENRNALASNQRCGILSKLFNYSDSSAL